MSVDVMTGLWDFWKDNAQLNALVPATSDRVSIGDVAELKDLPFVSMVHVSTTPEYTTSSAYVETVLAQINIYAESFHECGDVTHAAEAQYEWSTPTLPTGDKVIHVRRLSTLYTQEEENPTYWAGRIELEILVQRCQQ